MKKQSGPLACALAAAITGSGGCYGSFGLTNVIYDWNGDVSPSIVVKEIVFLALVILPVYELALVIDAVILNFVEFITGKPVITGEAAHSQHVATGEGSRRIEVDGQGARVRGEDGRVLARVMRDGDGVVVESATGRVRYDAHELLALEHVVRTRGALAIADFVRERALGNRALAQSLP